MFTKLENSLKKYNGFFLNADKYYYFFPKYKNY